MQVDYLIVLLRIITVVHYFTCMHLVDVQGKLLACFTLGLLNRLAVDV